MEGKILLSGRCERGLSCQEQLTKQRLMFKIGVTLNYKLKIYSITYLVNLINTSEGYRSE